LRPSGLAAILAPRSRSNRWRIRGLPRRSSIRPAKWGGPMTPVRRPKELASSPPKRKNARHRSSCLSRTSEHIRKWVTNNRASTAATPAHRSSVDSLLRRNAVQHKVSLEASFHSPSAIVDTSTTARPKAALPNPSMAEPKTTPRIAARSTEHQNGHAQRGSAISQACHSAARESPNSIRKAQT